MDKEKRYSFNKEEKDELQRLMQIFDSLFYQQQGIRMLMDKTVAKVQVRVGLDKDEVPEGYNRSMQLDEAKFELVIKDIAIPEPEKATN